MAVAMLNESRKRFRLVVSLVIESSWFAHIFSRALGKPVQVKQNPGQRLPCGAVGKGTRVCSGFDSAHGGALGRLESAHELRAFPGKSVALPGTCPGCGQCKAPCRKAQSLSVVGFSLDGMPSRAATGRRVTDKALTYAQS